MRKLIFAFALLSGFSAHAEETRQDCLDRASARSGGIPFTPEQLAANPYYANEALKLQARDEADARAKCDELPDVRTISLPGDRTVTCVAIRQAITCF